MNSTQNEIIPSEEELVARARALIPMLKEKAFKVEQDRMVSRETIDEFRKAGFFKVLQPKRWGGWQMSPVVYYRILMELGRGCGSSAWDAMVLGVHQWEFGQMDDRAAEDVWSKDNSVLVASSYAPWGECKRVEGGWILNGTWRTSSGCDHAEWAFLGGLVKDEKGNPVDRYAFLVSAKDYTIEDDWYVFGLAGTGSKSLVVKNAFVPDYRAHSQVDHSNVDKLDLVYRFPFNQAFFTAVSSVIVGMAQGAIDEYTNQMQVRKDIAGRVPVMMSPYVKDRLGNAVTRVRSSRARLFNAITEGLAYVEKGDCIPLDLRVHHLLDIARTGRECEEATMLLFKATGARGMYLSNRMQLILRNVIAGSQHITQNSDDTAGMLGGYLLGQPLPPLMFGPIEAA
ncbi:MAG TPA: acyl-CoA dehydrogenase family protein [Noviherbaspirillum sp.]|nr:acyl-CoA dehydrogenase family protein [Noviherbaspirillum sp.]